MRLLYIKEPQGDGDLKIVRQLTRLTADRKVTTVRSTSAAITALRRASAERPYDAIVTSPAVHDDLLGDLVHRIILNGGPPVMLVPIVVEESEFTRAYRAGADAVLLLQHGTLVNRDEVFRGLAPRFRRSRQPEPAVDAGAHGATPPTGTRMFVDLLKLQNYFHEKESPEPITVEAVRFVDEDLAEAVARLVPHISGSAAVPGFWELEQIVKDPNTALIVARDGAAVVGLLTLHTYRAVTGIHARIQDMVVSPTAKGRQVSELLTQEAVRLSVERGARTAELVSRHAQGGRSRLYERLGFEKGGLSLYRHRLSST